MKVFLALAWLPLSLFCLSALQAQTTNAAAELELMMQWFEGEFDNFQQVHREKLDSVPVDLRHNHIHSIFKKVEAPALSQHAFFVKQYLDGDKNKVYRQRMYAFSYDEQEKAIRLDIYAFASPELEKKYAQADQDPTPLKNLTMNELRATPGCEVFWKRNTPEYFDGYMKERACHFFSQRSNKRIYISDNLRLYPDAIWINDQAEDEQGNYVFGHKEHIPHKLRRVYYYTGWAAIKLPGAEKHTLVRGLRLHDGGQRTAIHDANGQVLPYEIELSVVSYSPTVEVLKLAIYEAGQSKSVGYTWAMPGSNRIGFNWRDMEAGFTRE